MRIGIGKWGDERGREREFLVYFCGRSGTPKDGREKDRQTETQRMLV